MRFRCVASDYDGTLATHGELHSATLATLRRVSESGRLLVLVTGRTLDGLALICPERDVFDVIVAENGAVVRDRETRETRLLAPPLPDEFGELCRNHGVREMHMGQVIAATWAGFEDGVQAAIAESGADLRLSYNKGSLMILPPGVDKASGLADVLTARGIEPSETIAFGDAENDVPMLSMVGCAVAVANALDEVKARAAVVTTSTHGEGVTEVLDALLAGGLEDSIRRAARRVG